MKKYQLASLSLLLLATVCLAQGQNLDPLNIRCLTPEEMGRFFETIRRLKIDFRIAQLIETSKLAMEARDAVAPEAAECDRRRNDNLFGNVLAELNGCMATLKRYNQLHKNEQIASESLGVGQEMIIRQIQIERTAYPHCR